VILNETDVVLSKSSLVLYGKYDFPFNAVHLKTKKPRLLPILHCTGMHMRLRHRSLYWGSIEFSGDYKSSKNRLMKYGFIGKIFVNYDAKNAFHLSFSNVEL
jgi:hypothetical protein